MLMVKESSLSLVSPSLGLWLGLTWRNFFCKAYANRSSLLTNDNGRLPRAGVPPGERLHGVLRNFIRPDFISFSKSGSIKLVCFLTPVACLSLSDCDVEVVVRGKDSSSNVTLRETFFCRGRDGGGGGGGGGGGAVTWER